MTALPATARPEPKAADTVIRALQARFGNRVVTSRAVREQHAHTQTFLPNQPPDAVVFRRTAGTLPRSSNSARRSACR